MMLRKPTLALLAVLVAAPMLRLDARQVGQGQPAAPGNERVGRIVAVAGDSAITNFALEEALLAFQAQTQLPPEGPELEQIRRQVLQDLVDHSLMIQAAARDTMIRIPEDDVNQRAQAEFDQRQSTVGGPVQFEQALRQSGLTQSEYRQFLTQQIRGQMLVQAYMQGERRARQAPRVTEEQMRRVLQEQQDRVGPRPTVITFQQLVVPPQPSAEARAAAEQRADSIYARLRSREDFAQLARRFSDDETTRDLGGDLGWFKRDELNPAFERVAFDMLRQGEVSSQVQTAAGYHIIKLERVRGAERLLRHILIGQDVEATDLQRTRELADSIAGLLRTGADIGPLHRQYGDPDEQFHIANFTVSDLPAPYDEQLDGVRAGQVVGPFALVSDEGATRWAIVRVTRYDDSGEWRLEDPLIRGELQRRLAEQLLDDEILEDLRRRYYIDIRL